MGGAGEAAHVAPNLGDDHLRGESTSRTPDLERASQTRPLDSLRSSERLAAPSASPAPPGGKYLRASRRASVQLQHKHANPL
jgi:hypothetical protein